MTEDSSILSLEELEDFFKKEEETIKQFDEYILKENNHFNVYDERPED